MINLDNKQVKKHIGFHYLLTQIQLCTLILLELSMFLKMYQTKSKINLSLTTYEEYNLIILLCVDFIVLLS